MLVFVYSIERVCICMWILVLRLMHCMFLDYHNSDIQCECEYIKELFVLNEDFVCRWSLCLRPSSRWVCVFGCACAAMLWWIHALHGNLCVFVKDTSWSVCVYLFFSYFLSTRLNLKIYFICLFGWARSIFSDWVIVLFQRSNLFDDYLLNQPFSSACRLFLLDIFRRKTLFRCKRVADCSYIHIWVIWKAYLNWR